MINIEIRFLLNYYYWKIKDFNAVEVEKKIYEAENANVVCLVLCNLGLKNSKTIILTLKIDHIRVDQQTVSSEALWEAFIDFLSAEHGIP